MKKFLICLIISVVVCLAVLSYFFFKDGSLLTVDKLFSPLAITIFVAIVFGIASAFLQVYSMLSKLYKQ